MRSVSGRPVALESLTLFSGPAPKSDTFGSGKDEKNYTTEHGGANPVARQDHASITRHRHAGPTGQDHSK